VKPNYKKRRRPQTNGYELKLKYGKVNRTSPEEVNLLTASDCLNVLPLLNGELDKRKGFSLAVNSPATGRITSLFKFERPSATEELITTLTGLYKRNGTGTTGLKTDFTSSTVYNIVNYNELAIVFNGVDVIQKYNGTTVAALGGTPPVAASETSSEYSQKGTVVISKSKYPVVAEVDTKAPKI